MVKPKSSCVGAQCCAALIVVLTLALTPSSQAMETVPIPGEPRQEPIKRVIIHATGGPDCEQARSFKRGSLSGIVKHFRANQGKISIHYIIGRDGQRVRMVPESAVAFHARGQNADSIGIELVNDGDGKDRFPEPQIRALVDLLAEILPRHRLGLLALQGHEEVDQGSISCQGRKIKRKQDPGAAFPWGEVLNQLRLRLQGSAAPVAALPAPAAPAPSATSKRSALPLPPPPSLGPESWGQPAPSEAPRRSNGAIFQR